MRNLRTAVLVRSESESLQLLVNLFSGRRPLKVTSPGGANQAVSPTALPSRRKRRRLRYSFVLSAILCGCSRTPNSGAATKAALVQSFSPRAGDDRLARGTVALESAVVSSNESTLTVAGTLPTPCHELRVSEAGAPDAEGFVRLEVWSVADPSQMCAQVLQPFSVQVPVKTGLRIKVNGQPVVK